MQKNVNVKNVPSSRVHFFRLWMDFLSPFHKLTNKETEVVSFLLYKRFLLKQEMSEKLVDNFLLTNRDIREELMQHMGYQSKQVLSNILTDLKSKGVIVSGKIVNGIIPNIEPDATAFNLVLNFKINED